MTNYMAHLLPSGSPAYRVFGKLQYNAMKDRFPPKISAEDIKGAKENIERLFWDLDAGSFPFAQNIYSHLFGQHERKRAILIARGNFYGEAETILDSVIPIDITPEVEGLVPKLLKDQGRQRTIDDMLSYTKTRDFLKEHERAFVNQGYRAFGLKSSRFFYFSESDLAGFRDKDGNIDVFDLARYIADISGYVGIMEVKSPSLQDYLGRIRTFTSFRLKTSSVEKITKDLETKASDPLGDLAANGIVFPGTEDIWRFVKYIHENGRIGNMDVQIVGKVKDFIRNPRKNKTSLFKAYLKTSSPDFEDQVRELQLITYEAYPNQEINRKHESHHSKHAQQKRLARANKLRMAAYEAIMAQIMGKDEQIIPI